MRPNEPRRSRIESKWKRQTPALARLSVPESMNQDQITVSTKAAALQI